MFGNPSYIDSAENRFQAFLGEAKSFNNNAAAGIKTGTTIIALMSPDKKTGIVASDGRVTAPPFVLKDNFEKVFDCSLGFIGAAGVLAAIQSVVPAYCLDLDLIGDSRRQPMTASGAIRRLFSYSQAINARSPREVAEFIALFWDHEEQASHLYCVQGGSFLRADRGFASIGSGSLIALPLLTKQFSNAPVPSDSSVMIQVARSLFSEVQRSDTATGGKCFFGIVDEGTFSTAEETL